MRLDWYSATVDDYPDKVIDRLCVDLSAKLRAGKAMHGYVRGWELMSAEGVACRVLEGGNKNAKPHAWASGAWSEAFAGVVRLRWPSRHYVTRVDSALDMEHQGAWRTICKSCLDVARELRLSVSMAGDWRRGEDEKGRTLYIGSRKSPTFVRAYEKGKQMACQGVLDASPDWVRLEAVVRPEGEARYKVASLTPEGVWGCSSTTRAVYDRCFGRVPEAVECPAHHMSDDAKAFDSMCRQYGNVLQRMATRLDFSSGWEQLGGRIGARVRRYSAERGGGHA